jgi:hypothetical protein
LNVWSIIVTAAVAAPGLESSVPPSGHYEVVPSLDGAQTVIDRAIDVVADEFFFMVRPIVRSKLRGVTDPCRYLNFDLDGDSVQTWCDRDDFAFSSPVDGQPRPFSLDGDEGALVHERRRGQLIQTFIGDGGTRKNVYRIEDDELRMAVMVSSPRFDVPLMYVLRYRRVGPVRPGPHRILGRNP